MMRWLFILALALAWGCADSPDPYSGELPDEDDDDDNDDGSGDTDADSDADGDGDADGDSDGDADGDSDADGDGACDNEQDEAVLGNNQIDLEMVLGECMYNCWGNGDMHGCITGCVANATGLTQECSACLADYGICTVNACAWECQDPYSAACTQCVEQHCLPDFEICAGISA